MTLIVVSHLTFNVGRQHFGPVGGPVKGKWEEGLPERVHSVEAWLGTIRYHRGRTHGVWPNHAPQASEQQLVLEKKRPYRRRKVQLLAAGRKSGNVVSGHPGKRQAYASRTRIEPTPEELQAFNDIKRFVTEELRLYHHDPAKQLFLQVDGSLERGFGVMVFHTAEDYVCRTPVCD
jgi:hypothetical protein